MSAPVTQHIGDCLTVMDGIADGSVDLVLADLPYGTTRNKWDSIIDLDAMWEQLARVAKADAAFVFTAQMPFTAVLWASNPKWFRHHWIWEKTSATGHLNARHSPMKAHEDVLVFARSRPTYNPQMTHGHPRKQSMARSQKRDRPAGSYNDFGPSDYDSTSRYPRSVQTFPHDRQKLALHRTQKPQALIEYLIRTYSNPGELILDPTSGSGTAGVAAAAAGRRAILIEQDEQIAAVALERLGLTLPEHLRSAAA